MELNCKIKVSAAVSQNNNSDLLKPIEVASGAFSDTKHYSGMTTEALYSILLYGTRDGRIPARNVLELLLFFAERNTDRLGEIYAQNIQNGVDAVGHAAGSFLNNQHVSLIQGFISPHNAPSTIAKKGFDKPFIDKGELITQIFYSINGEGRYK